MDMHGIRREHEEQLAKAIGSAVVAAAALEKTLLGEIYRRQMHEDVRLIDQLAGFDEQPAGRLLQKLREQGIDRDLADRIGEVLGRRNRLIHGFFEDIEVARAVITGERLAAVLDGIAKIEADCGVIIAKLQPRFATDLAEQLGMSLADTAGAVLRADLSKIPDAKDRAVLERARELIELTGWPNPPPPNDQQPHSGRTAE